MFTRRAAKGYTMMELEGAKPLFSSPGSSERINVFLECHLIAICFGLTIYNSRPAILTAPPLERTTIMQ